MTGAGDLDCRVTFRRRSIGVVAGGRETRGDYADYCAVWAEWRPLTARQLVEAGFTSDAVEGRLRIRDTALARSLTAEDRVVLHGQDCAIVSVSIPDRSGWIDVMVSRRLGG